MMFCVVRVAKSNVSYFQESVIRLLLLLLPLLLLLLLTVLLLLLLLLLLQLAAYHHNHVTFIRVSTAKRYATTFVDRVRYRHLYSLCTL